MQDLQNNDTIQTTLKIQLSNDEIRILNIKKSADLIKEGDILYDLSHVIALHKAIIKVWRKGKNSKYEITPLKNKSNTNKETLSIHPLFTLSNGQFIREVFKDDRKWCKTLILCCHDKQEGKKIVSTTHFYTKYFLACETLIEFLKEVIQDFKETNEDWFEAWRKEVLWQAEIKVVSVERK